MSGPIVCFGELLLRLSAPGRELLMQSPRLDIVVGGAEANVAAGLAALDHATAIVSTVPDNALGRGAVAAMRAAGVDTGLVATGPGRMGLYFLSPGAGVRASDIVYDRAGSAFVEAGDYDWPALLQGAARLHLSGITPALGPASAAHALAAARAARAAGVPVSFDGNYRARLWESWDSDPRAVLTELVAQADLFFGNHRDVALLTGRDAGEGRAAAEAAFAAFPNLAAIASTGRTVIDADHHRLSARLDTPEGAFETDEIAVTGIVDRIGGGDAFAAGILHGLHAALSPQETVEAGLALAALKHSLPGDFSRFTRADLAAFQAGARDVRR
jgi:2-dehydro-3-deoxygluconokinase